MRIQTAIIFANTDEDIIGTYMVFEHPVSFSESEVEARIREAVDKFVHTREGWEVAAGRGGFNWGDAAAHIPDEFWIEAGLNPIKIAPRVITLDHDENLYKNTPCPDEES